MPISNVHPASYRDPSGYIFTQDSIIYRQVNEVYAPHYELLMSSGLYQQLIEKKWLIEHEEVNDLHTSSDDQQKTFKILRPQRIGFITYPYEWCFSQLKEAALLTLKIQQLAMINGMSLKDATAFNITFDGSRAVFIDTLSFEKYEASRPWIAYRQFCETFLAPLLLAAWQDPDLIRLMVTYPDGIPIEICASLLPLSSKFKSISSLHIHLQSGIKGQVAKSGKSSGSFNANKLERIISHLISGVSSLQLNKKISNWSDYYTQTILQDNYLKDKERIVEEMIDKISFSTSIDLGSNTGQFALMLEKKGKKVIALDIDPLCVERLYQHSSEKKLNITTLVSDLVNPAPAIGWNNKERAALLQRLNGDLVLALALVHHLCIGKNLPFASLAEVTSNLGQYLIIEFVPKEDEKVKQLLSFREDIFQEYDIEHFRSAFAQYFEILQTSNVGSSRRTLFLMKKKNA